MYANKKILVTGGTGFIGRNLVDYLVSINAKVRAISRYNRMRLPREVEVIQGDLTDLSVCRKAADGMDYIFHLAAAGGGLAYNIAHPAKTLTPNLLMNTNMLEAARLENVERYLFCSSSSVYPPNIPILEEDKAWQGNPHESDSFFAWSKRMGELQAKAFAGEYNMPIAIVRLGNPYGPNDNFDVESAHVIPALVYKTINQENPLLVLGAGEAIRSFVHVRDVINAMTRVLEVCANCDPVNIASGESLKIKDLVKMIVELTEYKGEVRFDHSKPEGQLLKVMSIEKLKQLIGYEPKIPIREGLRETIDWYLNNRSTINNS